MKFRALIVGVRDFVSSKGKPLRLVYCTAEPNQEGLIGQTAFQIWQFQGDDYFSIPAKDLLDVECVCMEVSGKIVLMKVDGYDS